MTEQKYPPVEKRIKPLRHQRPRRLPGIDGDAGASGAARGEVETTEVPVVYTVDATGKARVHNQTVTRTVLPRIIGDQPESVQRAIQQYESACERVAGVPAPQGNPVDSSKVSDGGAASKVDAASELRRIRSYLSPFWIDPASGSVRISLAYLMDAVILDRKPLRRIARSHHWRNIPANDARLRQAFGFGGHQLEIAFGARRAMNPPDWMVEV